MSAPQTSVTPLHYATAEDVPPARPVWLLGPNALAGCVPFLHFYGDGQSITHFLASVAQGLFQTPSAGRWALALLLAGNFVTVPLLLWTIALVWRPTSATWERIVAWTLSGVLGVIWTLLTLYTLAAPHMTPRYLAAPIVSFLVLAAGGGMVAALWRLRRAFPTPLVALTLAMAGHIAFLICIFLVDYPKWTVGAFVTAFAGACQILGAGVCVRIWRGSAPA